jgi:hypothetical protein
VAVQVEVWPSLMLKPTDPVGIIPAPVTLTDTVTDEFGKTVLVRGLNVMPPGICESALLTVWLAVPELGVKFVSPR